jgi:hypothetical protein
MDSHQDLPLVCPRDGCKTNMPATPTPRLLELFRQLKPLTAVDKWSVAATRVEIDICLEIKSIRDKDRVLRLVHARGWPATINFSSLLDRIQAMRPDLEDMIKNKQARGRSVVCEQFMDELAVRGLGPDFTKLASMRQVPGELTDMARPG